MMKKYNLRVLSYTEDYTVTVYATTMSYGTSVYTFSDRNTIIACYPIDKTIITSIEDINE
jgi:hypothetical protein